jgi:hypothetical protein
MFRTLFSIAILFTASSGSFAQESSVICPPPRNVPVVMPPEAVRMNFKGEVQVSVRFDDCGVVTEAKVTKRSRLQSVNDAALYSSKLMVLNQEQRAKAVDGWYTRVFSFAGFNEPEGIKQVPVAWPASHANPLYVQDDSDIGFKTVAEADKTIADSVPNVVRPPAYPFVHRIVQVDAPNSREFWLFINSRGVTSVAARYRPIVENNQPVVHLAILCELNETQCNGVRELLMKGLPMAKAKQ